MVALRYDKDAGVRRKALEGLESYIPIDTRVRDAVLEALLHDPDAGCGRRRSGCWSRWKPTRACARCCKRWPAEDDNPHIRNVSRQYLEQVSQIQ